MPAAGSPLSEVTRELGGPEEDIVTPFECGSAFEEGDIRQLRYPNLILETDGTKAVVRSMTITAGNRLVFSDGEVVERLDEADFRRRFSNRAERVGDLYRVGASSVADWEAAYDYTFKNGKLVRVDYWIGC